MGKFLKHLISLIGVTLISALSYAIAPVTVTGNVQSITSSSCTGGTGGTNCFVQIRLRNYGGVTPTVVGLGTVVTLQAQIIPDASGNWSTTLWGNDNIRPNNCGIALTSPCTFYSIDFMYGGKQVSTGNWSFTGAGPFNLNSFPPIQTTPPPPPWPPIFRYVDLFGQVSSNVGKPDSGYCRLYFDTGLNSLTGVNSSGTPCLISGGGGGGSGFGIDATAFAGADPCVQTQAAIYSVSVNTVPIINATKFTSIPACSVNPFQAPSQSSPIVYTSVPSAGLLLLPGIAFPTDVPWYIPNKWTVLGVGGYGTNRTFVQPSATFRTNRVAQSAVGGASGCSASGGSTITISGSSFSTPANLIGMFVQCSSNASSTAIPTPKNSQIAGVVTNVTGTGPYTLTLSGAGASGTVTNTGWTINPVMMGWQPNSVVFGSTINQVTAYCSTPAATTVIGCIGFLDLTGNESAILSNFSVINYDYMGIGIFTSQSQNGGLLGPITLNSSNTGNNNTIGIEVGGTGWNANGGGGTGLCATGNPCSGVANRGFFGVTITGSGTGADDGGIGFDINANNVKVRDSHCESLKQCGLVGDSAAAQAVEFDNVTGCTNSGCRVTSIVDISASYQSGSAPAPTQNITVKNIQRAFSTTWLVRDFINLTGVINDPTLAVYTLGSNGAANRMIFTSSQLLSCITSLGVVDTNGANCAPATQLQIVSKISGTFYADGFNNSGSADVCIQINNTMKWAANVLGLLSGIYIDAKGFNRVSGYPCATNPFSGTLGTTIPASGVLQLGLAKFFFSTQWQVPANWEVLGSGGSGLGAGGASGTLLAPNINNTSNASYANDATAGTITATLGNYNITGSGTSWTTALINHYFLACVSLPCTTQASMVGGIVLGVGSTTSLTLDVPAQANLAGGSNYTITAPLVQNSGVIRDVAIDGNSYGTGGGNGNGGLVGVLENGGSSSYIDNMTLGHINGGGIDAVGLNNGELSRITVLGNSVAASVFTCITAAQGINIHILNCQAGTTPSLSYGIMASGNGFSISNVFLQNIVTGVELAINPSFSTNNVSITNVVSANGGGSVTTLIDLGSVGGGATGNLFEAHIMGLNCSACVNLIVDSRTGNTLTDTILGYYFLSRTNGSGNRSVITDSITPGIVTLQIAGSAVIGSGAQGLVSVGATGQFRFTTPIGISSGAGVPGAGTCTAANGGSVYLRTDGGTTTTLYVCDNATHVWTAK